MAEHKATRWLFWFLLGFICAIMTEPVWSAPQVTITADPAQVAAAGDATTLRWSAPGATSCRMTGSGAGGGWSSEWPVQGEEQAFVQAQHTFALECADAAGEIGAARVTVTIVGEDPFLEAGRTATCTPIRWAYRASLKRLYWGCQWADTLERETHWHDLTPAQVTAWKSTGSRMLRGYSIAPVTLPAAPGPQVADLCDRYWLWAEDEGATAPQMTRAQKLQQAGCK